MVDTPRHDPATSQQPHPGSDGHAGALHGDVRWKELQLQQANRSLEEFAISIAHDLKNPIAAVRGFAELLPQLIPDVPEHAKEIIDRLIANADRSVAMIDDLLEYARFARPYDEWRMVPLNDVLRWVEEMLGEEISTSGTTITIEQLPQVRGNASALRQVFLNLISNSIKYAAADRSPAITISSHPGQTQDTVAIMVADNGRGIAKDARDSVFRLGWRAEDSDVNGLGIGLAVCRVIIANHGGTITADEGPGGVGTTMTMVLPTGRV